MADYRSAVEERSRSDHYGWTAGRQLVFEDQTAPQTQTQTHHSAVRTAQTVAHRGWNPDSAARDSDQQLTLQSVEASSGHESDHCHPMDQKRWDGPVEVQLVGGHHHIVIVASAMCH